MRQRQDFPDFASSKKYDIEYRRRDGTFVGIRLVWIVVLIFGIIGVAPSLAGIMEKFGPERVAQFIRGP